MKLPSSTSLLSALALLPLGLCSPIRAKPWVSKRTEKECIAPKVFIISMFDPEAEVWWDIPEFDILAKNISVPGLSPVFPEVHCTADEDICQIIIGEAEINAASSMTALVFSGMFDLTKTYWMVGGISGINPEYGTLGSVAFSKYSIQVALQYEFDAREMNDTWDTGYVPLGARSPDQYPRSIYGTEVFELNTALRDKAFDFASSATLNDSETAMAYRANYASSDIYAPAAAGPGLIKCDVACSDVYYSGKLLSEGFGNFTKLMTNGSGEYCSTAQEDNATLEVLLRASLENLTDFSRALILRTASDFDRQYPGQDAVVNLMYVDQGGFLPALQNIYLAGIKVVMGILDGWDGEFEAGIPAPNYIGDIFGSLGGTPDFGPYDFDNNPVTPDKRSLGSGRLASRGFVPRSPRMQAAYLYR